MKTPLVSILLGFIFIFSGSAQAWSPGNEWIPGDKYFNSINQFFCNEKVIASSEEQSGENQETKEEEEEPDCD